MPARDDPPRILLALSGPGGAVARILHREDWSGLATLSIEGAGEVEIPGWILCAFLARMSAPTSAAEQDAASAFARAVEMLRARDTLDSLAAT